MEIEAHQTKNITVEISDYTAKQITGGLIRAACGLPDGCDIENNMLVQHFIEAWGSYSEPKTKTIREATELDKAACMVLAEIKKR